MKKQYLDNIREIIKMLKYYKGIFKSKFAHNNALNRFEQQLKN